jgi:hypothetical protein
MMKPFRLTDVEMIGRQNNETILMEELAKN